MAAFAYRDSARSSDVAGVRRASDRMACRGPDGDGVWMSADERVILGHRRLSIIDLSELGRQPMLDSRGSLAISFNGEIYNYRELRRELTHRGRRFTTESDTEVLLQLYDEYGDAMVSKLRGMFAFALWDHVRGRLVLARDTFGIKPLYYADDGRSIVVASEVKALRRAGVGSSTVSPAGEVGFFLFGYVPEPYTMFHDIRALSPGTVMIVERDRGARTRVFDSVRQIVADAEHASAVGDMPALVREAVLESVRYHLVSDVPVGIFLSSGIDSCALVALAAEVGSDVRTVTLGFDEYLGTDDDETRAAEQVAKQYGSTHHTIRIGEEDFDADLDRFLDRMDQPTIDGLNTYFVARAASQIGLKVAISGLGGDELFGGYPSFVGIPRLVRAARRIPAASIVGKTLRQLSAPLIGTITSPKYASALEYGGSYGDAYLLRRGLFLPWELDQVLDRETMVRGLSDLALTETFSGLTDGLESSHAKVSTLEACSYMRNQLLRDSDWASMSHSLEVRVPLVDASLWRALSPYMGRAGFSKRLLAAAARPSLPAAVLNRRKTGFTTPLRRWIAERPQFGEQTRGYRQWARAVHSSYLERAGRDGAGSLRSEPAVT